MYDSGGKSNCELTMIGTIMTFFTALGCLLIYLTIVLIPLDPIPKLIVVFLLLIPTAFTTVYMLSICPCLPFLWCGYCSTNKYDEELEMDRYDQITVSMPEILDVSDYEEWSSEELDSD